MTRADLYHNLKAFLPSSYEKDCDFRDHVTFLFNQYKTFLTELDSSARPNNWDITCRKIDTITNGLLEVIKLVYSGLHSQAHTKFKKISHLDSLNLYFINPNTNWYRVRSFDKKQNPTQKDMFHIPLNKRGIVKTQRYSSVGYPCLYRVHPSTFVGKNYIGQI